MSGNNAYFVNCVDDKLSVNLNNDIVPKYVTKHVPAQNEKIIMSTASFNIMPDPEKGKFGLNGPNQLEICFDVLSADHQNYRITVENMLERDLFLMCFMGKSPGQMRPV